MSDLPRTPGYRWVAVALSFEDWLNDRYVLGLLTPASPASREEMTAEMALQRATARIPCDDLGVPTRAVTPDDIAAYPTGTWAALDFPNQPGTVPAGRFAYPMEWIDELNTERDEVLLGVIVKLGYGDTLTDKTLRAVGDSAAKRLNLKED